MVYDGSLPSNRISRRCGCGTPRTNRPRWRRNFPSPQRGPWRSGRSCLPQARNHRRSGKEYWTNGRNWEIFNQEKRLAKPGNQYGRYRLEVSPADQGEKTRFLHLLQVGTAPIKNFAPARLIQNETQDGIELTCPETQRRYQLVFNRDGLIGGHISAWDADGKSILDQPLLENREPVKR